MRQWYAVHLKGKKLSNTARMFLDFLLTDGAQIWEEVQPHMQTKIASAVKKTQKAKRSKAAASPRNEAGGVGVKRAKILGKLASDRRAETGQKLTVGRLALMTGPGRDAGLRLDYIEPGPFNFVARAS